jgi:hypothetical protein
MPSGGQIVNRKWTYTLTSTYTSTTTNVPNSGYSLVDVVWGPWSEWSTVNPSPIQAWGFNVEEKSVENGYNVYHYVKGGWLAHELHVYYTNISGDYRYGTFVPYLEGEDYKESWFSISAWNNLSDIQPGEGVYSLADEWINSGTQASKDFWWIKNVTYETQYRYQTATFTFRKVENLETASNPAGQSGVSNVTELVQYRPK